MTYTDHTHNPAFSQARPDQRPNAQQFFQNVRQDKGAEYRASPASLQPASETENARAQGLNTEKERSQNRPSTHSKAEKVTIWLHPKVKAELERIAESEGLSISATGAVFLEKAIQSSLHEQHGALLEPIITQAIVRSMRAYSNRLAMLLVRVAFSSEQTRALVTNVLRRQPGVTPELLNTILDGSSNTAKRNITTRTPQLEEIIRELEEMIIQEKEERK